MYDIKIKIDGETYRKKDPTIRDYVGLMDYNKEFEGVNFMQDKDAFLGALKLIAEWFEIGDDLVQKLSLQEAFDTYKHIQSNVYEVFIGVPLEEAMKQMAQMRKEIHDLKSMDTHKD